MKDVIVMMLPSVGSIKMTKVMLVKTLKEFGKKLINQKLCKKIANTTNKKEQTKLKEKLPVLIPSVILKGGSKLDNVVQRQPVLAIDVDKIKVQKGKPRRPTKEEAIELRDELISCLGNYCFNIETSPSAKGVRGYLHIAYPEKYLEHWNAINKVIEDLGFELDPATKSIVQKYFIGYDPDAHFNESPEAWIELLKEEEPVKMEVVKSSKSNSTPVPREDKVEYYVSKLEELKIDITNERTNWLKVAFGFAQMGEVGRAYFHRVSQLCTEKYDVKDCDKMFNDVLKRFDSGERRATIGTFYYLCHENNVPRYPKKTSGGGSRVVEEILQARRFLERYQFRYNVVSGKPEMFDEEECAFVPITDKMENSLFMALCDAGIQCPVNILRSILNSDFIPDFHPIREYFYKLDPWDGKTDHIAQLAAAIVTSSQKYWSKAFKKWLVAVVASALVDKLINHQVLVLLGIQGLGKTTFLIGMIPLELKNYVYAGTINPDSKDSLVYLSQNFLIIMDELADLTRSDLSNLKALITLPSIQVRKPYEKHSENLPHRSSFAGSINDEQFLRDMTGSRRWLCFEALSINNKHGINLNLVYAQALALFEQGFKYWFDAEEIAEITSENERFEMRSTEEELLLKVFTPCPKDEAEYIFSTTEIAEHIKLISHDFRVTNSSVYSLGKALRKHGFCRFKRKGVYVYAVKRNPDDPDEYLCMKDGDVPLNLDGGQKVIKEDHQKPIK
ncbi:MAG: hypothetical protein COA97_02505 [Flavobacteriales bacterium]|nr:MAG: hypothetical protein COA97_02505 [Flavobacteriales bacterium]